MRLRGWLAEHLQASNVALNQVLNQFVAGTGSRALGG
jgi:hypothetical protein